MKRLFLSGGAVLIAAMALGAPSLSASGYVGVYGIVERVVVERAPVMTSSDLRVRPATEKPATPSLYQTESGIVKLAETGSHAAIVKLLKDALAAR